MYKLYIYKQIQNNIITDIAFEVSIANSVSENLEFSGENGDHKIITVENKKKLINSILNEISNTDIDDKYYKCIINKTIKILDFINNVLK